MEIPSSNPAEYCRLCFSKHQLQNVFQSFDQSKILLTQMGNCLGLWLASEQDFPCAVCRMCASALDTFDAFRERSADCDQVIRELRKNTEIQLAPMEAIKIEIEDDEDGSDREEGALVIDEPDELPDSLEEPTPNTPVWVPVENAKPREKARLVCVECEGTFSCNKSLKRHQLDMHGDPNIVGIPRTKTPKRGKTRHYSCGQCSAVFYGYGAALTHLAQAHKKIEESVAAEVITGDVQPEVAAEQPTQPPKSPSKKPLPCQQCNKRFSTLRSLDLHMRTACKIPMVQTADSVVSISPKELRSQLSTGCRKRANPNSRNSSYRCGICKEVVHGSAAYIAHRKNVHGWTEPVDPRKKPANGTDA